MYFYVVNHAAAAETAVGSEDKFYFTPDEHAHSSNRRHETQQKLYFLLKRTDHQSRVCARAHHSIARNLLFALQKFIPFQRKHISVSKPTLTPWQQPVVETNVKHGATITISGKARHILLGGAPEQQKRRISLLQPRPTQINRA